METAFFQLAAAAGTPSDATTWGVLVGLFAAFLQSVSYLVSGRYVRVSGRPAWTLLAPAFALSGLFSLALLPFVWPRGAGAGFPWAAALGCGALSMLLCLAGNGAMFFLLKHVDASRSSPLLALKVPMLALFASLALGRPCTPMQWGGVALVVAAAGLLAGAGRRISGRAWAWLLATCGAFAAADLFIVATFAVLEPAVPSTLRRTLFALALIYGEGGLLCAAALPFLPRFRAGAWRRHALPFAAAWFASMVALYFCFALCGVVLGNIVQSVRGLVSVALGWLVARAGRTELEERVGAGALARRVAAALLTLGAVALYALGAA